jgi:hypothetical protein
MCDSILTKLKNNGISNPEYSDTDSIHCNDEQFKEWVKNHNEITNHWPELEELMPEYKTHRLYEEGTKVFGSFDDELGEVSSKNFVKLFGEKPKNSDICLDNEIILGNKLYCIYNEEAYDKYVANGKFNEKAYKALKDNGFLKVSAAGVDLFKYWFINDLDELKNFAASKKVKFVEMLESIMVGEYPEEIINKFVYRYDPVKTFKNTHTKGYSIMIREIFKRNVIQNDSAEHSTIQINVDLKIMKSCDFIGTEEDKILMESMELMKKNNKNNK